MARFSRPSRIPCKPLDCFECQSRSRTEWCVLSRDDLAVLNETKVCQAYPAGQIIYHQGAPVRGIYCIESGTVAIRKTDPHGNSILIRLAHARQTVGYRDFFGGQGYTASAETLERSLVCHIDNAALRKLLDQNPALGLKFLTHIAADLESAEESILQQASLSVRTRLAHLLLTLKDQYAGVTENGAIVMSLPMTRQDMAALLGTRPETIARTIHAMENDSVVSFSGRTVMIPNLDILLDEIDPGSNA